MELIFAILVFLTLLKCSGQFGGEDFEILNATWIQNGVN